MVKVSATEIAKFDMLTNHLTRIQFWGVGRETSQENFLRPTTGEKFFRLVRTTELPQITNAASSTQIIRLPSHQAFFFRSGQTAVRRRSILFSLRSCRAA